MPDAARINFLWLLRLRWGAILGQTVTIVVVRWILQMPLPLAFLFGIIAVEAATNVACHRRAAAIRPIEPWMLGALMVLDVLLLTALLYLTGGAFNPFSFLYLVHIALAAVVLTAGWTWALVGLSLACFGSLFLLPPWPSVAGPGADLHADHMHMHLQGMWVAFAVAATFIVYFVQRVRGALAERDRQLAEAHDLTLRNEKLASLATLAAGAAHELSTPLSTIAVVARELEHLLVRVGGDGAPVADARLIREQVARCRAILVQMTAGAGESIGETTETLTVGVLLNEAVEGLGSRGQIELFAGDAASRLVNVPRGAVVRAIRNVLKNALEASQNGQPVQVRASVSRGECFFEIEDHGSGMPPPVLARAGEPFFTTKEPGMGMGLGLFLSRAVFQRLGGRLALDSELGKGTRVRLVMPLRDPASATGHDNG